jgi:hypothetical protein
VVYAKSGKQSISPSYENGTRVFLIDLRENLPDSITVGTEAVHYDFKNMIPSAVEYKYYSDLVDIHFPKGSLFDTTYLQLNYDEADKRFQIGDPLIPLHRNISVTLKPVETYPENTSVYGVSGRNYSYLGGNWSNGKVSFNTREFGKYVLLRDTVPPSISKVAVNGVVARFRIRDDLSGISYYEANLNGEWLLMNYDYKTGMIWSEKSDSKEPLSGDLTLKVVDKAGNEATYAQKI